MNNDKGVQKAAILMLAIGEAEAAEVMRYLGPREVLKLGAAMAAMKSVQHFARTEVAHHLGRLDLADGEHQDGRLLDPAVVTHSSLPPRT